MNRNFLTLMLFVLSLTVSCKKESVNEPTINDNPRKYGFRVTIDDQSQANLPRRRGGSMTTMTHMAGLYTIWDIGDKIRVNGRDFVVDTIEGDRKDVYFSSIDARGEGPYYAFYPKELQNPNNWNPAGNGGKPFGTLPGTYRHDPDHVSLPMYGRSNVGGQDTNLVFTNICGVLRIMIPSGVTKITVSEIYSQSKLWGSFEIVNVRGVEYAEMKSSGEGDNTITILPKVGETYLDDSRAVYVPLPPTGRSTYTLQLTLYGLNNSVILDKTIGDNRDGFTVEANKFYSVCADDNLLPRRVKISNNPAWYVYFAKGNLVYNSTTGEFSLENGQDVVQSSWDPTHVSHFFYCDDVTKAAAATFDLANLSQTLFCDYEHRIEVNGSHGFYCLNKNEWNSLIANNSHVSKTLSTASGSSQFFIFAANASSYNSVDNCTQDGVLCLPQNLYYRTDDGINTSETTGRLWTSTDSDDQSDSQAYCFDFSSSSPSVIQNGKANGYCIRLVKDAD